MSCSGDDIILNYIAVAGILNANRQRGASVPVFTESLYLLQTKQTKQHNNHKCVLCSTIGFDQGVLVEKQKEWQGLMLFKIWSLRDHKMISHDFSVM